MKTNLISIKKCLSIFMVLSLMILSLTGCMGIGVGITYNNDGTCSYTEKYYVEEAAYGYMLVEDDLEGFYFINSGDYQTEKVNLNGKNYYTYSRSFHFSNQEELKKFLTDGDTYTSYLIKDSAKPSAYDDFAEVSPFSEIIMDENGFMGEINPEGALAIYTSDFSEYSSDVQKAGYNTLGEYYHSIGIVSDVSVTLPSSIVESNGVVSDKTASWSIDIMPVDGKLIAATSGNPISSDTQVPVVAGVKEGKCYAYGAALVEVSDNVWLKSLTLDGKQMTSNAFFVSTHGKHTIVATDGNNNTTTVNFKVDAKAPKIKGVKNGKKYKKVVNLRFSDDDGVKYIKVNNKKMKNKKKLKIKKPGKYTVQVYDKSGNMTFKTFTIKKKK